VAPEDIDDPNVRIFAFNVYVVTGGGPVDAVLEIHTPVWIVPCSIFESGRHDVIQIAFLVKVKGFMGGTFTDPL
jgi:hypothetical protein